MKIPVGDISDAIRMMFDETKLASIETVYEKIDNSDELKLILFFHNVFYNNTNVIYTKIIFITDKDKMILTNNNFTYLYDINCEYKKVEFDSVEDFKSKIKKIFDDKKFGTQIKALSDFIKNPSTLINKWLSDNGVTDKSVIGFKYEPKITIMPCKSLFFSFAINLNDRFDINLTIVKENSKTYNLTFKLNDKETSVDIRDLNMLSQEIGYYIKHKV